MGSQDRLKGMLGGRKVEREVGEGGGQRGQVEKEDDGEREEGEKRYRRGGEKKHLDLLCGESWF